jgi:hypothetical protein
LEKNKLIIKNKSFIMENNKSLKFARLAYSHSNNLGDQIQTLATEKFLGDNPVSIERYELDKYDGEKVIMIMQGYFCSDKNHCTFPPSEKIIPVFVGFHIEQLPCSMSLYSSRHFIDYFKKHQPIGCRDRATKEFLLKHGVDAYLSRCLTLTFPARDSQIKGNKVFFIDEPQWMKSSRFSGKKFKKMYKEGVFLTQIIDEQPVGILDDSVKRKMAIDRIELLKSEAKLVITSRLHVASPCVAMGIPVLLFPDELIKWNRHKTLEGIIPIYTFSSKYFKIFGMFHSIITRIIRIIYIRFFMNWNPTPPDITNLKTNLVEKVQTAVKKAIEEFDK